MKIKKGHQYLCISDYVMDSGSIACKKGKIYKSKKNNTLKTTIDDYHCFKDENDFLDYFELIQKSDPIVKSVISQFKQRSKVGIKKYGTTLHENNFDDFYEHLKQELMDAILYLEKLKTKKP